MPSFGAACGWPRYTAIFTPTSLLQCKQQLKGITADCPAAKQNDPKHPKMKLLEDKSEHVPEVIAPRVNSDVHLLRFTLKVRP